MDNSILLGECLARVNDMVVITEADRLDAPHGPRIVFVNEAVVTKTGYSREEIIGQTPRMFQGQATSRTELDRIRRALDNCEPVRSEILNYDKSGNPFWLEIDISPVADEAGRVSHFIAVQRDVSRRKQAELQREEMQTRFDLVLKATNEVIWDYDISSGEIWWNQNYHLVFGHPLTGEPMGRNSWIDHIAPEDRDRIEKSLQNFVDSRDVHWKETYRFQSASGAECHVLHRGLALRNEEGEALRVVGSLSDQTESMILNERLRQSEKLDSLGQLTGSIAHDFNNLLTVILGNSESLKERLPDGPMRQMADLSLRAADSGAELVRGLLAFARRQPLNATIVDLSERLQSSQTFLQRTVPESTSIRFDLERAPSTAAIDVTQFDNAIINLCLNAHDAMPDGGTITISIRETTFDQESVVPGFDVRPGRFIEVSVCDTGTGMDAETAAKAFEPFFTTKPVGAGSGLGLSMVHGFVKQSGGHMRLDTVPGAGTCVRMFFPSEVASTAAGMAETAPATHVESVQILVVEDNEFVLEHAIRLLSEMGHCVHYASTAADALDLLSTTTGIELLFTDVVLPGGMNGEELARAALEIKPGLKVLFTTGYAKEMTIRQGRLTREATLISKPYRKVDLRERIQDVLGQPSSSAAEPTSL